MQTSLFSRQMADRTWITFMKLWLVGSGFVAKGQMTQLKRNGVSIMYLILIILVRLSF
jgi:hypothetical protein